MNTAEAHIGSTTASRSEADDRIEAPDDSRRLMSPLTRRILAVNLIAPFVLVAGLLYLDRYEQKLIESEMAVLSSQAQLYALALGQSAVEQPDTDAVQLSRELVGRIANRITPPGAARVRVFDASGVLMVDSRRILGPGGLIRIEQLPPPAEETPLGLLLVQLYESAVDLFPFTRREVYAEPSDQRADDYDEAVAALAGESATGVRRAPNGPLILTVTEPIRHYQRAIGVLMLSVEGRQIDAAVRSVRLDILTVFGAALVLTVLLSIYLANAIARPVYTLAGAARRMRGRAASDIEIPDLSSRGDEIGDLSAALREMTEALRQRMTATERFAADVAHEIKNPLSSLRSAVETASRIDDPVRQQRLMAIIVEDVQRLDRLISDISDASRLEAEMSRTQSEPIDLARMLETLIELETTAREDMADAPRIELDRSGGGPFVVSGIESRLVQVFHNLLANAFSFSPPRGRVRVRVSRSEDWIVMTMDDDGPGIPAGKEDAIFERFYSERPEGEKFGTHSGLGLSISRQIVETHGGHLRAATRRGPSEEALGARFTVWLPAASRGRATSAR